MPTPHTCTPSPEPQKPQPGLARSGALAVPCLHAQWETRAGVQGLEGPFLPALLGVPVTTCATSSRVPVGYCESEDTGLAHQSCGGQLTGCGPLVPHRLPDRGRGAGQGKGLIGSSGSWQGREQGLVPWWGQILQG